MVPTAPPELRLCARDVLRRPTDGGDGCRTGALVRAGTGTRARPRARVLSDVWEVVVVAPRPLLPLLLLLPPLLLLLRE